MPHRVDDLLAELEGLVVSLRGHVEDLKNETDKAKRQKAAESGRDAVDDH